MYLYCMIFYFISTFGYRGGEICHLPSQLYAGSVGPPGPAPDGRRIEIYVMYYSFIFIFAACRVTRLCMDAFEPR